MKTIFFGSSDYCLPVVESLNNHFALAAIITKKGQPVEKFALSHNVVSFTPKDINELSALKNQLNKLQPDLAVVADYGLIIPKEIFTIPRYKTLNIHFSKLPLLRGPSPVQYTILLGEKSAWISVIIMDEGIDTGDIVWQKEIKSFNSQHLTINNETSKSLYEKLFNIIALELPDIIKKYVNNELKPQKQNHSQATYTKYLTREDGFIPSQLLDMAIKGINPSKDQLMHWSFYNSLSNQFIIYHLSFIIEHAVRALTPWPGVWTEVALRHPRGGRLEQSGSHDSPGVEESEQRHTKRLKILKVHLEQSTINNQQSTILVPDLVQLEGRKPVTWKQFVEGYPANTFITQV